MNRKPEHGNWGPHDTIPVGGPWITEHEVQRVADAAANAWYEGAGSLEREFETTFAAHVGRAHAVSLPSCTSAIHLALAALGVGPGDEVIVPDITWIASAAPISYVGATPVFADIDPATWCIDARSIRDCITAKTKAIIAVDLYGGMPDYADIESIANEHGLAIIEDAAQAIGSSLAGRPAGSFGDLGVFSFHGSKTLTTGEGGMLVTSRDDLIERVRVLRDHGRAPGDRTFFNREVAFKYKMNAFAAAMGLAQLERLSDILEAKRAVFECYLRELEGVRGVVLNPTRPELVNSTWMVTARLTNPAIPKHQVMESLRRVGIDTRPFFHPLSTLPAYGDDPRTAAQARVARTRNHNAAAISPFALNLPSSPLMRPQHVERVCRGLVACIANCEDAA